MSWSGIAGHGRYHEALVETAVVMNAVLTAYTLQQELQAIDGNAAQATYGVYQLRGHEVRAPHSEAARRDLTNIREIWRGVR